MFTFPISTDELHANLQAMHRAGKIKARTSVHVATKDGEEWKSSAPIIPEANEENESIVSRVLGHADAKTRLVRDASDPVRLNLSGAVRMAFTGEELRKATERKLADKNTKAAPVNAS